MEGDIMNLMFAGSEATPFCKTGGLADVLGSLPYELAKRGHNVMLVLPNHQVVKQKFASKVKHLGQQTIKMHEKEAYVGFQMLKHDGVTVYFIDNEYYFGNRENLYGDFDDGERYGYFSRAIVSLINHLGKSIDVLHLNDWQTGMVPYIIKHHTSNKIRSIKTLFTIHNIAYQGQFAKDLFPYLDVPYSPDIEYDDMINFLKTGISTATHLSTVSKSYAQELQYAYFGYGMETILTTRQNDFDGILNGIDYHYFSPKNDQSIDTKYSLRNYIKGKANNKTALQTMFQLPKKDVPIYGIVTRLTDQKGLNLLSDIIEPYLENDAMQLIVLGSGDQDLELFFEYLRHKFSHNVGIYIGYSDRIARYIYAGSDFFIMPSKYEPCGLSQLISLAYGTLPIVRKTGGLKDSIAPFNKFTKEGNGFSFQNFDTYDLKHAIDESLEVYHDEKTFKLLRRRAMNEDFSWTKSADQYELLYKKIISK